MLAFPDPNHFFAGSLHAHVSAWSTLASEASFPLTQSILDWITDKVRVYVILKRRAIIEKVHLAGVQ